MRPLPQHTSAGASRQGIVLLLVLAMLTLFASLALSFVFYAEAEANAAQVTRDSLTLFLPDADPEELLAYFLGQVIYDTDNPYSALRGHSLARTLYGYNPNGNTTLNGTNAMPFNGFGRAHYTIPVAGNTSATVVRVPPVKVPFDNYNFINHQDFSQSTSDGFAHDPEANNIKGSANYFVGANAPYTYPDLNNVLLGAVDASGEVLVPSGHRLWNANLFATTIPAVPYNFWADSNAYAKYLTLRPHRSYHSQFPDPEDGFADVRNFPFGPGWRQPNNSYATNDSFWIDVGYPVLTAANGKKYKPLFAPLLIDLDNRIHLWVSGNQRGGSNANVSNMGFGPDEINLQTVLNNPNSEVANLFTRRFGGAATSNTYPATGANVPAAGPPYAPIDFDGVNSGQYSLPSGFSTWRTFPTGWDNANPAERANNNLAFNYYKQTGNDKATLKAQQMEALLRFMDTNAPATTSDLMQALYVNLTGTSMPSPRGYVTLLSWSFDRQLGAPYIWYDPYNPSSGQPTYTLSSGNYPTISANPKYADFSTPSTITANANTEFLSSEARYSTAQTLRTNLFSPNLPHYPAPDATGMINLVLPANLIQYTNARTARQNLAKDIYKRLVVLTGAQDPTTMAKGGGYDPSAATFAAQYAAARWLAQLAVNIVDYLDNDDYITDFNWATYPDSKGNTIYDFVYGTEMPRLVINEAYVQYDLVATMTNLNVWVELLNPFNTTSGSYPRDGGTATLLRTDTTPAYQVVICPQDTSFENPGNTAGDPNPSDSLNKTSSDWGAPTALLKTVLPANGAASGTSGSNQGFYVLGPVDTSLNSGGDPGLPTTAKSPNMTIPWTGTLANPSILLRRLAVPHLPFDNTKMIGSLPNPKYNPFITVDYLKNVPANDNRVYTPATMQTFAAYGRKQPYTAYLSMDANSQVVAQTPTDQAAGKPKHTFFRHNFSDPKNPPTTSTPTLTVPFDWLVHLDRPLANIYELMQVSAFAPHKLTQQFYNVPQGGTTVQAFQHTAPWTTEAALIYRLLDQIGGPSRLAGMYPGGREPGRVNVNTLFDQAPFSALCDPQTGSRFSAANVTTIFGNMLASRMPGDSSNTAYTIPRNYPSGADRPFRSFAAAYVPAGNNDRQYPYGSGIQDTLLRDNVFQLPATVTHPYQKWELLQKIANNVTTTSNVFALWVTVGFFEVVDDSVQPPKLGDELGRSENRNRRHRFFAIIDRSELALIRTITTLAPTTVAGVTTIAVRDALNGTYPNGNAWQLPAGALLEIGPDPTTGLSEVVTVASVNTSTKTITVNSSLVNTYGANTPVVWRSNPGPQVRYNPRNDRAVVPHYSVIE